MVGVTKRAVTWPDTMVSHQLSQQIQWPIPFHISFTYKKNLKQQQQIMRKKTKVSAGFHDNRLHYSSSRHTIYINLPPSNIRYPQHKAATQRASLIQYSVLGSNFSIRQRLDFCLLCLADERLLSHKRLFSVTMETNKNYKLVSLCSIDRTTN